MQVQERTNPAKRLGSIDPDSNTIALTIPSVDFEMHNQRLTIHNKERNVHTCCLLSPNLSTIAGTTEMGKKYKSSISKKI